MDRYGTAPRLNTKTQHNMSDVRRSRIELTMASVASERRCLHEDLLERGDASNTCDDDDDAFSCRTDHTHYCQSLERVACHGTQCEELGFWFLGARRRKKQTICFRLFWSHLLMHLLEGKSAHPFVTFSLSPSLSLSYHHHPAWPRIHTSLAKVSLLDDSVTLRH
jgi:hypothetical protein